MQTNDKVLIFSHVNQWQSVQWANKYKILILNSHFRLRKLRSSYQGTKNVAIYAFSSGKILDVGKIAGVKNMTNIMSGSTVGGGKSMNLPMSCVSKPVPGSIAVVVRLVGRCRTWGYLQVRSRKGHLGQKQWKRKWTPFPSWTHIDHPWRGEQG